MRFSDYIIYADESGNANPLVVDSDFPVFVLVCCMFHKEDYISRFVPEVERLKFRFFGHDAVVLHEQEIRHRARPFVFLANIERRQEFMNELQHIIEAVPFEIIAAVVDKESAASRTGADPYQLALQSCLRRAHQFLGANGQLDRRTHVVLEARGRNEDRALRDGFERIRLGEGSIQAMDEFELVFAKKHLNLSGIQFADLMARPIGLARLRPDQPNRAWEAIRSKLRLVEKSDRLSRAIETIPEIAKDPGQ